MALDCALEPPPQARFLIMAPRRKTDLAHLEETLGHVFTDRGHLERALTHISALPGTPANGPHYQRLEFLGDRVLGIVMADLLFREFPEATEGELSRRLGHLVRRETCAEVARDWKVAPFLRLGAGESQSGLRTKDAMLADVCEALIAAVFIDGGYETAYALVKRAFGPKINEPGRQTRDAKSTLQEWALGLGLPAPRYREVERSGPDHAPVFVIAAVIEGLEPCTGKGASKRLAEHDAAFNFLVREGIAMDGVTG